MEKASPSQWALWHMYLPVIKYEVDRCPVAVITALGSRLTATQVAMFLNFTNPYNSALDLKDPRSAGGFYTQYLCFYISNHIDYTQLFLFQEFQR